MAKLIVTRRREFAGGLRQYEFRILIDGDRVARVGPEKAVEIDLPPGRHRVIAQVDVLSRHPVEIDVGADFLRSQPVEIDIGEDGVCALRVRSNLGGWRGFRFAFLLSMLLIVAMLLINSTDRFWFSHPSDRIWLAMVMTPTTMLPVLVQIAYIFVRRDHFLRIEEVPSADPAARRVAFRRVRPDPPRVTIRGMMIAVAVLAVILGAWIEWARYTRRSSFQNRANVYANSEVPFRKVQEDFARSAEVWTKSGLDLTSLRQMAAKATARADYYAAMKRKYEEAAARRWLAVEPDPPAPPWP
jgi:hypothetical protein